MGAGGIGYRPACRPGTGPIRSALGSCCRHKGHLVALLGSLNDSQKRPDDKVPLKGNVRYRAPLFPPRNLSGALFRRPNSQRGKRECRAKLKILFVSSSLASPGDRLRADCGLAFFQQCKGAKGRKAPQVRDRAGFPSDQGDSLLLVSSLGPTPRPCLTIYERNDLPEECARPISVPRIVSKISSRASLSTFLCSNARSNTPAPDAAFSPQ